MALETGTGYYKITLTYRVYVRTGTGTEPCIQFQLWTAPNSAIPIWTQSNKVHTTTIMETVAALGRTAWQSGCCVWYCGLYHGNGWKILSQRETNATSTAPVYCDAESTTVEIMKIA